MTHGQHDDIIQKEQAGENSRSPAFFLIIMNLFNTESSLKGRIDSILPRVAKPARYMGGELNSIWKPLDEVSVRIALAFPDVYEVGMSNLGLRILYSILNSMPEVAAERTFAPASDMESEMRRASVPLFSLESALPVKDFDLVGFSLAYELSYTTVLNMLDLAGIPLFTRDRGEEAPIVIAGGHCASNPEPMTDFIDAFVIGDGEEVIVDIVKAYQENRGNRSRVLDAFSRIEGVYVPLVHNAADKEKKVRGRVVIDLEHAHFPETLVVPFTEAVHDRVVVEIMRGCSRGCRFCQAGMITRPVRERSLATLCKQAAELLEKTGYEEIALTSLSSADHSNIKELVHTLIDRHEANKVGVALPSLRADAQCVQLAAEIQRVRKSGLTFAPEAGTQRLRDVINKNVTEQDLLEAVEAAIEAGWRRVKLYFMIGLPTETDDDLRGIGELVTRVIDIGRKHHAPIMLNVTLSPFVPKPHTPFQWRGMVNPEELERRLSIVRPLLRGKNISLSWHDPYSSRVEAALARGDSSLGMVIHQVWKHGGKFEQDCFDAERWNAAFETAGLDIAEYANLDIPRDAPLPWDFIDVGVSKKFLQREDERADHEETTPDCRSGVCSACGVREALARTCGSSVKCPPPVPSSSPLAGEKDAAVQWVRGGGEGGTPVLFTFRKGKELKWLGHLDMMRVFERAIRMSGIPITYTQGFNPRVKMSIASALPLGATADNELITIHLMEISDVNDVMSRLNVCLPNGLDLLSAEILPENKKGPVIIAGEFIVTLTLPDAASMEKLESAVKQLMDRDSIPFIRESGRNRKKIDLRPGIESIKIESREPEVENTHVHIKIVVKHLTFTVKPVEVVALLSEYVPGLELVSLHRSRLITI